MAKKHHSSSSHSSHPASHSAKHPAKNADPDKGPPMMEAPHQWDKGYVSDEADFSPPGAFPDDHMRGNHYMKLQNEIVGKDSKKLNREKFSKIH